MAFALLVTSMQLEKTKPSTRSETNENKSIWKLTEYRGRSHTLTWIKMSFETLLLVLTLEGFLHNLTTEMKKKFFINGLN